MTNNDREDKSGAFEQGEILSAIEPQPPTENKVVPFNPLDMASLAGLKAPNPAESALAITEQEENIAESKTKLPVYKQSFYKMATIGGALLVAALALGAIVFGDKSKKQSQRHLRQPLVHLTSLKRILDQILGLESLIPN